MQDCFVGRPVDDLMKATWPHTRSNVNHDFDDRRFGMLLSMAKSVRSLRILNSPGPGPSDCYEVFLNLQKLQELHVEVCAYMRMCVYLPQPAEDCMLWCAHANACVSAFKASC